MESLRRILICYYLALKHVNDIWTLERWIAMAQYPISHRVLSSYNPVRPGFLPDNKILHGGSATDLGESLAGVKVDWGMESGGCRQVELLAATGSLPLFLRCCGGLQPFYNEYSGRMFLLLIAVCLLKCALTARSVLSRCHSIQQRVTRLELLKLQ